MTKNFQSQIIENDHNLPQSKMSNKILFFFPYLSVSTILIPNKLNNGFHFSASYLNNLYD